MSIFRDNLTVFFHVINIRKGIKFDEDTLIEFEGYGIDIAPRQGVLLCILAVFFLFGAWSFFWI